MLLDERYLVILRIFLNGPVTMRKVLDEVPKTAAYRRVKKLIRMGLMYQDGHLRGLLPAGREALKAAEVPPAALPGIEKFVPHVSLGPTAVHRAELKLIASAVVLKQHRVTESHHASFFPFGPKLTFKTWLAKAACLMAGVNPQEFVLNLGVETPGSIFQRRGAQGQVVTQQLAISQPVAGFDELGRAKPETARALKAILHGERIVPVDNDNVEIICVPIVMTNPRTTKDEAELWEKLGIDDGILRRTVPADHGKVCFREKLLTMGEELHDRMRALGPAEFPKPRHPDWRPTTEIQAILLAVADCPERLADIDVVMVALLCTGLTAWLPRDEALREGISSYLEIISTLGWLKPEWRTALARALDMTAGAETETPAPNGTVLELNAGPLSYSAKVDVILSHFRELGITPEEAVEMMSTVKDIGLEDFRSTVALNAELKAASLGLEHVLTLHACARDLAQAAGTRESRAAVLLRALTRTLIRAQPPDADERQNRAALASLTAAGVDVGSLRTRAKALRKEVADLQHQCAEDREAADRAREARAEAESAKAEAEEDIGLLYEERDALGEKCYQLSTDLEICREIRALLQRGVMRKGPLARELRQALETGPKDKLRIRASPLSPKTRKAIFEWFLCRLSQWIVPVHELQAYQQEARRHALRTVRQEFMEKLEKIRDSKTSESEAIRLAADALFRIRLLELTTWSR